MAFRDNVFVNCPFDDAYLPLLRPLLFCVIYVGLNPRIALEALDSGAPRFEKIVSLVQQSKFAIHDLSRMQSSSAGEYFGLNMPFELGLDVGCRLFRRGQASTKRCLILEAEPYRYKAAISDLSNSDIAVHGNEPVKLITEVRNWLNAEARLKAPGPADVWSRFNEFMASNYVDLKGRGYSDSDIDSLPVGELIACMQEWVERSARLR
jgi:hypothetical protein